MGEPSHARPPAWWADSDCQAEPAPERPNRQAEPQAVRSRARPPAWWARDHQAESPDHAGPQDPASGQPEPVREDLDPEREQPAAVREDSDPVRKLPAPVVREPPEPDHLAEPSWTTVLATTLRLWLERRGLHTPAGPDAGPGSAWRRFGLLGLVLVVFAAGALTVALVLHTTETSSNNAAGPGGSSLGAAAAARGRAASWIVRQVSRAAIVACDPVMCPVLEAHGFPSGSLLTLRPTAGDPLGSDIVVATAALRSQFGGRLTSEYAPVTIASFGSATARVEVLVTAADGAAAYLSALHADLRARQASGAQLLRNPMLTASAPVRAELAAGQVDARLLVTLVALAGQQQPVHILAFGGAGPGASPGVPLRTAELAGPAGAANGSYLHSVQAFLRAQRAPYLASMITTARLAGGRTVLLVGFAAPSPLGLLGNQASGTSGKAPQQQKN
jgi:hypothetical protein